MYYTFKQAKEKLARFADGGVCGVGEAINDAIERLATTESWRCMERIVRIYSRDQVLPLPQNVAAIIRANVLGTPSHIWDTDYQFISSGPGDLDYRHGGLGLTDIGAGHCVMFDIPIGQTAQLFAFSDNEQDAGKVIQARVLIQDGTERSLDITIARWIGHRAGAFSSANVKSTSQYCAKIDRVILPDNLQGYISLYARLADDDIRFLAKYHPRLIVPDFRRYRVNPTITDKGPISILAMVRLNFIPLVDDNDVIPFDSLAAVQTMIQSIKAANAEEIDKAMQLQGMAVGLMESKQQSQTRSQGLVVENALYDFSPGAQTYLYQNL